MDGQIGQRDNRSGYEIRQTSYRLSSPVEYRQPQ